ncbi:MAG: indole-3-glycerol phosphate synthase TrpC [Acidobacteriia bacterium]|nr:indole-3-glycerol phosphate synthase TrpC [Terriglobia bacterium]
MTHAVPDILSRIVQHKRTELAERSSRRPALERLAENGIVARRPYLAALQSRSPAIISEIKKASPSKGLLSANFHPAAIAKSYAQGGAVALSVLTDEQFFQGAIADLEAARAACRLPVLRKDFTIDEFHVIEAAAAGADAILLITAILSTPQLTHLRQLASHYGMASLVEVHDEEELKSALDSGAEIVGVNNRNLHDFTVTLETSQRLAEYMPANIYKVTESGIHTAGDVRLLMQSGYGAFLVGEHLMKSPDPAQALRELLL